MADDNNFDPKKIIEALRAKGIPDSEIKKLYPNYDFGEDQKKSQQRQQKTKKPKEPKEPKKTWSTTDSERLKKMFANGYSPEELANEFGTSPKQVIDQVEKLKKNGWDGAAPLTPEQRLANKRKFERLRNATGKTGKVIGKGIYKGASKLNEHFGGAAAANIEKNFGLLGRGFNRLTGLGYSKIDEETLKDKLKKEESGGGVSVEALNKTTAIIIGSISNLNHSISHGTTLLGRVIGKATSKVIDKISNIESVVKKLNYTKIIRQRKEDMLGGGNGLGGKSSFAKLALVGGVALASGMALNALLPEDSKTDETPPDAEKKPQLENKNTSSIGTNNDGSSEELRIKASEIKFNAKDIEFEYDKLTMEGRDFFQNQKGNGGASGSWAPQDDSSDGSSTNKLSQGSVFSNPDTSNPQTDLGGYTPKKSARTTDEKFDPSTYTPFRTPGAATAFGIDRDTDFSPDMSSSSPDRTKESFTKTTGISKDNVPEWIGSTGYKGVSVQNKQSALGGKFSDRAKSLYDRLVDPNGMFKEFNLTKNEAAAIVANAMHESGESLNPRVKGDNGTAHGIFQWRNERHRGLLKYAQDHNLDPMSDDAQYGYLAHEFRTTENKAFQRFKAAPDNPFAKTNEFNRRIERSADYSGNRERTAGRLVNSIKDRPSITPFDKINGDNPIAPPIPFAQQWKPQTPTVYVEPTYNSGSKLNSLKIDDDTQPPPQPKKQQDSSIKQQSNQFAENKTFVEGVLETQGPNHFAESGFPDGNLGILS